VITKFCLPRTLILVDEVVDDIVTKHLNEVGKREECDVVAASRACCRHGDRAAARRSR